MLISPVTVESVAISGREGPVFATFLPPNVNQTSQPSLFKTEKRRLAS